MLKTASQTSLARSFQPLFPLVTVPLGRVAARFLASKTRRVQGITHLIPGGISDQNSHFPCGTAWVLDSSAGKNGRCVAILLFFGRRVLLEVCRNYR